MGWSFAIVNGKLAEIFFDRRKNKAIFYGHAYLNEDEYKTKQEKKWIKLDTAKHKFSYRKGVYKDKMGNTFESAEFETELALSN